MGDWGQYEDIEVDESNQESHPEGRVNKTQKSKQASKISTKTLEPIVRDAPGSKQQNDQHDIDKTENRKINSVSSDSQILGGNHENIVASRREITVTTTDEVNGGHTPQYGSLQAAHQRILDSGLTFSEAKSEIWKLRKTGWLYKRGFRYRKRWVKRYIELSGRMLKYYESKPKDEAGRANYRNCLELTQNTKVLAIPASPEFQFPFIVIPDGCTEGEEDTIEGFSWISACVKSNIQCKRVSDVNFSEAGFVWRFAARTESDRQDWIHSIKKSIGLIKRVEVKPTLSGVGSVHNHYRIGEQIGQGRYGVVYGAVALTTGKEYAIKAVNKEKQVKSKDDASMLRGEIKILRRVTREVDHVHICKLYQAYEDNFMVYLVMERLDGGDLLQHISKSYEGTYSEAIVFDIIRQIASALNELHKIGIIVCDLQPKSMLFTSPTSNVLKLHEFGRAMTINTMGRSSSVVSRNSSATFTQGMASARHQRTHALLGSPEYLAPEVVSQRDYSPASDMWSLGVIYFLLLTGTEPFKRKTQTATFQAVVQGLQADQLQPEHWSSVSTASRQLVGSLLNPNKIRRTEAQAVLQHEYTSNAAPSLHLDQVHTRLKDLAASMREEKIAARLKLMEANTVTAEMLRGGGRMDMESVDSASPASEPGMRQQQSIVPEFTTGNRQSDGLITSNSDHQHLDTKLMELLQSNTSGLDFERRSQLLALDLHAEQVRKSRRPSTSPVMFSTQRDRSVLGSQNSSISSNMDSQANFTPAGRFLTDLEGQMRLVRETEQKSTPPRSYAISAEEAFARTNGEANN